MNVVLVSHDNLFTDVMYPVTPLACLLAWAGESRRIVMKDVLKTQGEGVEIKSRAVPQSAIDHYR